MAFRSDVVYRYDGSFEGMMSCVYEAFYLREEPSAIFVGQEAQLSVFERRDIVTDADRARRVMDAVALKISRAAAQLIAQAFLTCLADKERQVLRFLRLGFRVGPGVMYMLADEAVGALHRATRHLGGEAHLLTGFIRFSDYGGVLVAIIEPKNAVLPLIADHFCDRYAGEAFMILDKTHALALCHRGGRRELMHIKDIELPEVSDDERRYRALWKRFYDVIGIEGRYNPKCRMSHMPKRYWAHMTEFQPQPTESGPGRAIYEHKRLEMGRAGI